jgi:hypothetical protein
MLAEIEDAAHILTSSLTADQLDTEMDELMMHWRIRSKLMQQSTVCHEPVLAVRRHLLTFADPSADRDRYISELLLQSSSIASQ